MASSQAKTDITRLRSYKYTIRTQLNPNDKNPHVVLFGGGAANPDDIEDAFVYVDGAVIGKIYYTMNGGEVRIPAEYFSSNGLVFSQVTREHFFKGIRDEHTWWLLHQKSTDLSR